MSQFALSLHLQSWIIVALAGQKNRRGKMMVAWYMLDEGMMRWVVDLRNHEGSILREDRKSRERRVVFLGLRLLLHLDGPRESRIAFLARKGCFLKRWVYYLLMVVLFAVVMSSVDLFDHQVVGNRGKLY
jgi:hypothetical protein